MSDVLLGALIALAGVVVGIIGQAVIAGRTFRSEKRWAIAEQKREHLERIWVAVEGISDTYTTALSATLNYIGDPSPVSLDLYRENAKRIPWADAEMLVNLYMPSLADDMRAFHILGLEVTRAMLEETQRALHRVVNANEASTRLNDLNSKMTESIVKIRHRVVAESANLEGQRRRLSK
jgi:hypothetical protein